MLPKHDAVGAITANAANMQAELNIVWDKLLPAFHDAPLPENPDAAGRLKAALTGLKATR